VTVSKENPARLKELPSRLHHCGYVVRDQEINRQFMEGVLGIPLAATWCEITHNPELNRDVEFCHTFYEIGDGSAIAFFQFADSELYDLTRARVPAKVTRFDHIGFKVSEGAFAELLKRLEVAEQKHRVIEHGYCKSLYVQSSDGLELEFVVDPAEQEEIIATKRRAAHEELRNWLNGDHRSNNHLKKAHA
jgi:glyoxylase I family protein